MTPLRELDVNKLSTLILPHVDQATCTECCKFYMVPTTAPCGHTLCHGCWLGRKKCAICRAAVDRRTLKLNLQLQKITEHTHNLRELYEKIFNIELDELSLDGPVEKESMKDPTKNVREWLANSENQFSAPECSQQSTHGVNRQPKEISCTVQIHNEISKIGGKKLHVGIPQDDWDKIEEMPHTEELHLQNKENAVGPMDIEPFVDDQLEFTSDKPRRSSRKRDSKGDTLVNAEIHSVDKKSTKTSSNATDSKALKNKQKWANVNRMKKEFSKLNKKYKNKLNVSIEMCKKTQYPNKKNVPKPNIDHSEDMILSIDEITPKIDNTKECIKSASHTENDVVDTDKIQKGIDLTSQVEEVVGMANVQGSNVLKNTVLFNSQNVHVAPVAFIMKGALQAHAYCASNVSIEEKDSYCDNNNPQCITVNTDKATNSTDDIEITIKVGNTLTNICIKKKEQNVQYKINADREIQTSLDKCEVENKKNASCSPIRVIPQENDGRTMTQKNLENKSQNHELQTSTHIIKVMSANKAPSSKKNTESADTATATVQYEITESIEKELSKEMDKEDVQSSTRNSKTNVNPVVSDNILDEDCLNDLDLFDNDSMKEGHVQTLKSSNHPPSEILMSTMKSKKPSNKRVSDTLYFNLPTSKKFKVTPKDNGNTNISINFKKLDDDSELHNYDQVMGQVFANIDLDLEKQSDKVNLQDPQSLQTINDDIVTSLRPVVTPNLCNSMQGQSENVFSLLGKENNSSHIENSKNQSQCLAQPSSGQHLTELNQEPHAATSCFSVEVIDPEISTPVQTKDDDSDESIVEETPQKSSSFHKVKQKSGGSLQLENISKNKSLKLKRTEFNSMQKANTPSNVVINLSDITDDTGRNSRHVTVMEAPKSRPTLETPLTINKFVDQIKHKSTPMAKKSLNFDNENTEITDADPEQTLCPSLFLVAKTTQEKEFMSKAFEVSPRTRARSPLAMRSPNVRTMKYCLAGSCLTPSEITNVKLLCSLRNWDYSEKYTGDITHLVVGVDEENKSQRSVKYMCALAASKWIVSYEWIQKCLQLKKIIDEEPFEALDGTGDPGPRRSRLATQKLFQGITFFCMPPFSVLDVDTLKAILEAAGGRVVATAQAVRVSGSAPALLLAEPEHTQEDRFIYLAMELSIVPVNYEWVLNCLGSYAISSLQELLLCPASLLPPATAHWPPALMAKEYD